MNMISFLVESRRALVCVLLLLNLAGLGCDALKCNCQPPQGVPNCQNGVEECSVGSQGCRTILFKGEVALKSCASTSTNKKFWDCVMKEFKGSGECVNINTEQEENDVTRKCFTESQGAGAGAGGGNNGGTGGGGARQQKAFPRIRCECYSGDKCNGASHDNAGGGGSNVHAHLFPSSVGLLGILAVMAARLSIWNGNGSS